MQRILCRARVAACALVAGVLVGHAAAQIVVQPGFDIDTFVQGQDVDQLAVAPSSFAPYEGHLFASVSATNQILRIDPAGVISVFANVGDQPSYLAFGDSESPNAGLLISCKSTPGNSLRGRLVRLDTFATGGDFGPTAPSAGFTTGGVGIALSVASSPFRALVYSGASAGSAGDCISRTVGGGEIPELFVAINGTPGPVYAGAPGGLAISFARPGFGDNLFVALHAGGDSPISGVYVVDPAGNRTALADAGTSPLIGGIHAIEFGPGGDFGGNLYAVDEAGRILRIDSAGVVTAFVTGIADNGAEPAASALAFQGANAMFFNERATQRIYRVRPSCPGDLNHDRQADLQDLAQLLSHFGTESGATRDDGDLNGDGAVSLADLAVLLSTFGSTC